MDDGNFNVDALIDQLIEREGGYVNHPADKGGPTCFGITEAVARAHEYAGATRSLPRHEAAAIYRRLYWLRPRFDQVAKRSERIATAVRHWRQHGPRGRDDLPPARADGAQPQCQGLCRSDSGRPRRSADPARARRLPRDAREEGGRDRADACARSLARGNLRLAERRPANEAFLYGWLANRIGTMG